MDVGRVFKPMIQEFPAMSFASRFLAALVLAYGSVAFAVYVPVYTPTYVPLFIPNVPVDTTTTYALKKVDVATHTRRRGWDTLVRSRDTLGLIVATPTLGSDIDYRVDAKAWRDSLPEGFRKSLAGIRPQGSVVEVRASPISDTLPLEIQVWKGGGRTTASSDTIGATRQIVLERPDSLPDLRAVLVVSARIRSRTILPTEYSGSTALDILLGWGLWNPATARWMAWGMTPLRTSRSDIGALDASSVADHLTRAVVDEADIPPGFGGVLRAEKKALYGGLLLGLGFRPGFHVGGNLYDMAKESGNSVTQYEITCEAGWFSDWWGLDVSLPFSEWTSMDTRQGNGNSQSVELFHGFSPSVEAVAFFPVQGTAVIAGLGAGHMKLTGDANGWGLNPPSGSGWFWFPSIGIYLPWRYTYLRSDLGLEFQSYDMTHGYPYKSTLFFFDLRFGLRLAHE
jgi:hypothetical protein